MFVAERHVRSRPVRDVCALQAVLAIISNKWVPAVFEHLSGATELSYGDLYRRIHGASRKMLSATLRNLVRDGLVQRSPRTGPPPQRVYYRLTNLGRSLVDSLDGLHAWADSHVHVIEAARQPRAD
ncbi:hypothetical protein BVU76_05780 [Mycolicibacterium porcinum]|nr:hypothetical protein BVU76_05780 [Mycolicibacterium porcinum]